MEETLAKKIIKEIVPIAKQFMGIADELGDEDVVSMYLSKSHVGFFVKQNGIDEDGVIWFNSEYKKRGEVVLTSGSKEYGRNDE